jgi:hypothetical protein
MVLSLPQIKERLKNRPNSAAIQDAISHEERIQLHTKAVNDKKKASAYYTTFIQWVKEDIKLPADKLAAFEGMMQFPVATTALCNAIFDEYEKIFTAQDAYFDIEMLDDTLKDDFKEYLKTINVHQYFKTKGFEELKRQPGSIYVVDMATMQNSPRPEPYFYKVSIRNVIDIEEEKLPDGTTRIGYLAFKIAPKRAVVLDDNAYQVWEIDDKGEWQNVLYNLHILGYTPACWAVRTALYDSEDESPFARKTPLSDSAGDLDYLLFYKVCERVLETYGVWPIMTVPKTDCTYLDGFNNPCRSGYTTGIHPDTGKAYSHRCPSCERNSIVGPGTVFTRPVPKQKDDPQLVNAVEITPADVESLQYITDKIDYLEREIFANNVGDTDTTITKEAVNENQVQANVEGKRNVLHRIKRDPELNEKFIVDTMGRLRYGSYYVGCTVNYGEQFLLFTTEEMTLQYMDFKKAGLPNYMVGQKKQLLIQTEYKSNPMQQQRAFILDRLEPWPDLSIPECVTYQLDLKFPDKFFLKLDFAKFVSKFEMQNKTDIVQWGSALPFDIKIDRLNEILLSYGKNESGSAKQLPEPAKAGQGQK